MKVLVTGGAGFIGSRLAKRLASQGHNVKILDNLSPQVHGPNAQFPPDIAAQVICIQGDVTVQHDVEVALDDVDCVIHMAAETGMGQSQYEIKRYFDVNVGGMATLLNVIANTPRPVQRVVLPSSCRVYGEGPYECELHGRVFPASRSTEQLATGVWEIKCPICGKRIKPLSCLENDPLKPGSMYAVTKATQEQMLHLFGQLYGVETVVLRYQNVYGAGQALRNPYTGVMSVFCTRIRNGFVPEVYEDGAPTRDFVNIADVVDATVASAEKPHVSGETINIGSGSNQSIMAVAQHILQTFGSPLKPAISGKYRTGDVRHMVADIHKAQDLLDYCPKVTLADGIQKLVAWVLDQAVEEDLSARALAELKQRGLVPQARETQ